MGDKDEVTIHRDALKAIGERLEKDVESYSGNGSPSDLASNGNVTVAQLGNYPAGQGYAASIANAQRSVGGEVYTKFITAYKQAVNAIKMSAENYRNAEDSSEKSGRNQEQGVGVSDTQQV